MRVLSQIELAQVSGAGVTIGSDGTITMDFESMTGQPMGDGGMLFVGVEENGDSWTIFEDSNGDTQIYAPDGELYYESAS